MIAHSVRDKEIDAEFISLMKARDVPYCPTLTRELSTFVYESTPAFFADPFFTEGGRPCGRRAAEGAGAPGGDGEVSERADLQGAAADRAAQSQEGDRRRHH